MNVLTGAFHVVAVVIVVGGAAKVSSPDAFATLLSSLGLRRSPALARVVGVAEMAIGGSAVIVGGRPATAVVAALYVVFAVAVLLARRTGAPSCGCFGAASAPPSVVHAVVNLASAATAVAATVGGDVPHLSQVLSDQPLAAVPYVVTVATGAWLLVTIDTVGSAVADGVADVAALGPVFQENSTGSRHTHHGSART